MRLLFLGAGATGGYFGGRLAAAGADVTFLVRPRRAAALAEHGLVVRSPRGDLATPVKTAIGVRPGDTFDAIVLSAKAYDLASAIDAIRPAVGPATLILPLLNGMRHLDLLDDVFGSDRVLGGTCHISVTLDDAGVVHHFSPLDVLTQGPRHPVQRAGSQELDRQLARGGFEARLSDDVIGAMWEKWVLLATLAGMTCLKRASIGEIMQMPGGRQMTSDMLDECCRVATASGHAPRSAAVAFARSILTDPQSPITASMLRDLQAGRAIEADHIIGDLIARGGSLGVPVPLLQMAYADLDAYQRARAAAAPPV